MLYRYICSSLQAPVGPQSKLMKQKVSSGYSNLTNHAETHGQFHDVMREYTVVGNLTGATWSNRSVRSSRSQCNTSESSIITMYCQCIANENPTTSTATIIIIVVV